MSQEEIASPTAEAVTQESAPEQQNVEVETHSEEIDHDYAPENTEQEGAAPSGAEKRIKQLAAQRRSEQEARIKAEQEAAYYRGLADARGNKQETVHPQVVQQAQPLVRPNLEDFESYSDWEIKNEEYLTNVAEQRIMQRLQAQNAQTAKQAAFHKFQQRISEAAEADPTIAQAVSDRTLPISDTMSELLQQSDDAPAVLKWLYNNRKESGRISSLPPLMAAKAMGAIESQLKNAPKPAPPKKVSAAPEPIRPVSPSGSAIVDEASLPIDEWIARRNKSAGYR